MKDLKYLIASSGRSGSVYISRLLTSLGIMCGHESIFNENGRSDTSHCSKFDVLKKKYIEPWFDKEKQIAESSYMSVPFLSLISKETKIVHLTRHPLDVLSSWHLDINFFREDNDDIWHRFIFKHMPELKDINPGIEQACYFIINWNKKIEPFAHIRFKVEDLPNKEFFNFLNIEGSDSYFKNTKINSWKKEPKSFKEKIPEYFMDFVYEYGYKVTKFI